MHQINMVSSVAHLHEECTRISTTNIRSIRGKEITIIFQVTGADGRLTYNIFTIFDVVDHAVFQVSDNSLDDVNEADELGLCAFVWSMDLDQMNSFLFAPML